MMGIITAALITMVLLVVGKSDDIVERRSRRSIRDTQVVDETKTREINDGFACFNEHVTKTGGFCLHEEEVFDGHNEVWDGSMCSGLENLFGNATVVDFGAGLGHYGRCFFRKKENVIHSNNQYEMDYMEKNYIHEMKKGGLLDKPKTIASWKGYDGALNIEKVSRGFVKYLDLTKDVDTGEKFDWVMSLEVGEHIPKEFENTFLKNLIAHACKGIVLSWALDVREGHFHVNPQPNEYIQMKMGRFGILHDPERQDILRKTVSMAHFKPTVMVFKVPEGQCRS